MPKRRGHGEGALYPRRDKAGKVERWIGVVDLGPDPATGKRRQYRISGRTKREVQDELARALDDKAKDQLTPNDRRTVGEYLTLWLESVARPRVAARTYEGYQTIVEHHVIPALGDTRLQRLGPQDLQALYTRLGAGHSAQTVRNIHRCIHTALETALRWGLVSRNVADLVDAPRVSRREQRYLSPGQARALLAAATTDPLECYYVLALTTGMREGELLALKWADVCEGTIRLQRSLAETADGWVEKDLKSHQSRAISLAPIAVAALKRQKVRQAKQWLRAGARYQDRGYVLTSGAGSHLRPQNILRRSFLPLLERAGLPRIRLYDLRHSAASLLLATGAHPKVVAELLGHSSVKLTLDTYSHALPTLQGEAIGRLDELLRGES